MLFWRVGVFSFQFFSGECRRVYRCGWCLSFFFMNSNVIYFSFVHHGMSPVSKTHTASDEHDYQYLNRRRFKNADVSILRSPAARPMISPFSCARRIRYGNTCTTTTRRVQLCQQSNQSSQCVAVSACVRVGV